MVRKHNNHSLTAPMVAAVVFLLIALVHLGRVLGNWGVVVRGVEFPRWLS